MRADQARQIPIQTFLERAGIQPAKVAKQGRELWYSSPIRDGDKTPSFKVDTVRNLWFDHGMARGGNVIDLVIEMRRVTVKEALAILESGFGGSFPAARPLADKTPAGEKEKDAGSSFKVLDTRPVTHRALLDYVDGRAIPRKLVARYLKEVRFAPAESRKQFFAVGFPSGDGFDVRSAVFKGFAGTGKDISKLAFAGKGTVAVFEGAFDFLSWLAWRGIEEPDCAVIVMHSTALRRRALDAITEHGFGRVLLYLDSDDAGRSTAAYFKSELGNRNVVDGSAQYARHKDLAERWVAEGASLTGTP